MPPETDLYAPVKRFLTAQGYDVKGEIGACDLLGVKPGNPNLVVIAELKRTLSLELLLQAVDRLPCADEVWLAVPATRKGRDRDSRARKLCRLLGLGLLAIHQPRGHIEILTHPEPYRPRPNHRRRRSLLAEHAARHGDPSPGGTARIPIMTAYRQEALSCAAAMRDTPRRPRDLRPGAPRAAAILARNVYGWFERVDRGLYALTQDGQAALTKWTDPA